MSAHRVPGWQAFGLMALLCAAWGMQQVVAKVSSADVPVLMQAGLRSVIATLCLSMWARARGIALHERDGTLRAGLLAGLLFAAEFVCLFIAVTLTPASRLVVFLYTAPCLTILGLHWFVGGEKLRLGQWAGVLLAFAGLIVAFHDGLTRGGATLAGDLLAVAAAVLWAATTVVVRASRLAKISATKTLYYQLAVSALALMALAIASGQHMALRITPLAITSLFYQGVLIAFASYLAWFWLLTRYLASRLSIFSFLTPLFGVAFGHLLLNEPLSASFLAAALLVVGGILLVNWPESTPAVKRNGGSAEAS